jgi:hypothetical protein
MHSNTSPFNEHQHLTVMQHDELINVNERQPLMVFGEPFDAIPVRPCLVGIAKVFEVISVSCYPLRRISSTGS